MAMLVMGKSSRRPLAPSFADILTSVSTWKIQRPMSPALMTHSLCCHHRYEALTPHRGLDRLQRHRHHTSQPTSCRTTGRPLATATLVPCQLAIHPLPKATPRLLRPSPWRLLACHLLGRCHQVHGSATAAGTADGGGGTVGDQAAILSLQRGARSAGVALTQRRRRCLTSPR